MGDSLFTWDALKTISSSSMLAFLIVAYTKSLIKRFFPWLPTDIYTVIVCFLILASSEIFTSGVKSLSIGLFILAFYNSFLIASAASHLEEKSINYPKLKSKTDNDLGVVQTTNTTDTASSAQTSTVVSVTDTVLDTTNSGNNNSQQ